MESNPTLEEQKQFLARLLAALEKTGIPYMITGSVGSSIYGEPRATRDVDLIIAPTERQLRDFVRDISPDYYVSLDAALDALKNRAMFNVIDGHTSWKADFIICKNALYEKEKFERRLSGEFLGLPLVVATPEDIILSKLNWSKATASEMQVRDAAGIVRLQGDRLDLAYLRRWAKSLGVEDLLEKLLGEEK
jgi:uncharacterized protein (DUF1330 family)